MLSNINSIIVELCNLRYNTFVMKKYRHPDIRKISLPDVMQALSDPCRIKIIRHLLSEEDRHFACNEIPLRVCKATRSHHFDVLREAGLIRTCVDGTKCLTSLRREEIDKRFPGLWKLIGAV